MKPVFISKYTKHSFLPKRIAMRLCAVLMLCAFWVGKTSAQQPNLFTPSYANPLRLPAVPILTNDPYFSVWSPFDQLNAGTTTHWTGDEKPIEGYLRVDGVTYRFMGAEDRPQLLPVVPMADKQAWTGSYLKGQAPSGWQNPKFDDGGWAKGQGAFGTDNMHDVHTPWTGDHTDIYVRRTVHLTAEDLKSDLYLVFSHDDAAEIYLNGKQVGKGRMDLVEDEHIHLSAEQKKLLRVGDNVIAMHCYNNTGGAFVDFGLYKDVAVRDYKILAAKQLSVSVMATSTYYSFVCGKVKLDLVFTAPMLMDDYDLLSSPVNYVSYQVQSLDRRSHSVQLMLSASPRLAVNRASQPTETQKVAVAGRQYLRTGTVEQPILAKKGDGICIDWGYLYIPGVNGNLSIMSPQQAKKLFCATGQLPDTCNAVRSDCEGNMPMLCYSHDFGHTSRASSFGMIGYDEVEDIEYMFHRYKGYWAHGGKVTIMDVFARMERDYAKIMERCRAFDKQVYDDAAAAGGTQYADILSGAYRQVMAAHKLFRDKDGNLLFFSKENNSNGCVNTVDLTYPSAPLFLVYRPELSKAMMTSILEYSKSGRWTKPFAAHDLGTYPIADGQVYGGDMPLEESGNILILCVQLCKEDGDTAYVNRYWNVLTTWADYLAQNGQDPANQLCTDDFAGHWAHNCNLSVKAIMGVAAYAELARMRGDRKTADAYMSKAQAMAVKWESDARDGDHYKLAFDRPGTWSQKYNMVWDKLWNTNLFPNSVMQKEVTYYLTKQNRYGLPLDNRKDYTKSDWIMWTAAMASDRPTFQKFVAPLYNYINETESRVPISDWHDTKTGRMVGFKARSVIGGYWMKVLLNKYQYDNK